MGLNGKKNRKIFLSAGEASGDLHGSHLVRALMNREPEAHVACLGGRLLRQAGAELLVDNSELAVVGLSEVLGRLKVIYGAWCKIKRYLEREKPDTIVLIDYPDFNFFLARLASKLGIKVFYYISPQVWAWRSGRVRTLKRLADTMAVILPFEQAFYEQHGMGVHYVGHPLLDVLSDAPSHEEAKIRYRQGRTGPVVGLLPGSRHSEIASLLPPLLGAASILMRRIPNLSFLLPVASTLDAGLISGMAAERDVPVQVVSNDTHGVIRACDLVIAASGTVTMETAILGTPMIIIYKVSGISYHLGRSLIRVKHVGMPNVIAGRQIVPELLQDDATPERIAEEALTFLKNPDRLDRQRRELALLSDCLGEPGVADRVAQLVLELMHS
jgi:lipid-A-disaccharide synthase